MFGLKFQEEWYVLGQGDDWRALVYRGGTLQGPYPRRNFAFRLIGTVYITLLYNAVAYNALISNVLIYYTSFFARA